jgi:hypothetical protein
MSTRKKILKAAISGRLDLERRAPIILQLMDRSILGVPRNINIFRLALASVVYLTSLHEVGKLKLSLQEISDIKDKISNLTKNKIDTEIADATVIINTDSSLSYDVALAGVIAMNLSAARTATLTAILQTMRDSNKTSAISVITTSVTNIAKDSAKLVLNRTTNNITEKLNNLTDDYKDLLTAIIKESTSPLLNGKVPIPRRR